VQGMVAKATFKINCRLQRHGDDQAFDVAAGVKRKEPRGLFWERRDDEFRTDLGASSILSACADLPFGCLFCV
jgi:hypothetical protein